MDTGSQHLSRRQQRHRQKNHRRNKKVIVITKTDISCGVAQLSRLNRTPKVMIREAYEHNEEGKEWAEEFIHLLWSDNLGATGTTRGGQKLAIVIREEKLGKLFVSRARRNPNSGNQIKTWMWAVNWRAVKEYLK